jgi:CyaY protein
MTDLEYMDRAEQLLLAIEQCVRPYQRGHRCRHRQPAQGGMITLVFANGSQIVSQPAKALARDLAGMRAPVDTTTVFDGLVWQDTKGAGEFFARLSRDAPRAIGSGAALSRLRRLRALGDAPTRWKRQLRNRSRILLRSSGAGASCGATPDPARPALPAQARNAGIAGVFVVEPFAADIDHARWHGGLHHRDALEGVP